MHLYFKLNQRFVRQTQATGHLQLFAGFGALLRCDPDGKYSLLVPCGRRPLAVEKALYRQAPESQWSSVAVDEDGGEILLRESDEFAYLDSGNGKP